MRWFISIRYLLAHLRQSVVCVAGVTISVMMFIAMTSMMNGFTDKFIIETVESSGHITIHDEPRETRTPILERFYTDPNALLVVQGVKPRDKIEKIKNPAGLLATLRRMPGIVAVAPQVSGDLIATYGTKTMNLSALGGYKTESWQESNANFLKIFKIQTIITYIITAALLIVAAFGVLNILVMAVLERVNDIAILKSFGLSRGDITQIYVFQGLVIG